MPCVMQLCKSKGRVGFQGSGVGSAPPGVSNALCKAFLSARRACGVRVRGSHHSVLAMPSFCPMQMSSGIPSAMHFCKVNRHPCVKQLCKARRACGVRVRGSHHSVLAMPSFCPMQMLSGIPEVRSSHLIIGTWGSQWCEDSFQAVENA